jgi:hypothetical protein
MSLIESFWEEAFGESLRQGEFLPLCPVPVVQEKPRVSDLQIRTRR